MRKSVILMLLFNLLLATSLFAQDWQNVQSFEGSGFFYTNVQWLSDSKVIVSRGGTLYMSEDKGSTWTTKNLNNDSQQGDVMAMHFIDQNTGFMSYEANISGSNASTNTRLYKTSNGGETWQLFYDHENAPLKIELSTLYGLNESLVFAGGFYRKYDSTEVGYPGYFLTVDMENGISVSGRILDFYTGSLNDGQIDAIAFIDEDTGFVINGHKLLKTMNGGTSWTEVYDSRPDVDDPFVAYDFSLRIQDGNVIALYAGSLMFSSDEGDSWEDRAPSDTSSYDGLHITSDGTMFVYIDYGESGLYKSTDMGLSWTKVFDEKRFYNIFLQGVEGDESIVTFAFADENVGIIVTSNGIYRTETGGVITDIEKTDQLVKNFSLSQNYPNPFNPSTTISYSIPEQSNVLLKVYDALGREVAELINTEKAAGNYEVNFDASKLSSGIYFYTLNAGNFSQTRKMLLVK